MDKQKAIKIAKQIKKDSPEIFPENSGDSNLESNQVQMENETTPQNVSIEMKINTEVIIP